MARIAILGAGMAGFGAAYRLNTEGVRSTLYEKNSYHGGHAASFSCDGFIFDYGPHVSFTKDARIQKLFAESVNNEYEVFQARVKNYWNGYWIKHPAQCNLYGLPKKLVVNILADFVHAQNNEYGKIKNYEDWLITSYGKTFAQTFPMNYGLKFHTTTADNMSTEWVGPRLYRPDLKEVLNGALSPDTPDVHYVNDFRYPSRKGFVSYLNLFLNQTNINLKYELFALDPKNSMLYFANKKAYPYDYVISSLPLPELIPMISGVPADIVHASKRLACTTCVIINVGIDREDISNSHWIYFYDQEFCFTRLSFPHMQSPHNVPPGTGSIQAEIYHSKKYHPLDRSPKEYIQPVISDLLRCGLLREDDEILFTDTKTIPYANVIFDLDRASALSKVMGYLKEIGVFPCGRYGEWGYHWTDEAFISGENAAQKVLDSM